MQHCLKTMDATKDAPIAVAGENKEAEAAVAEQDWEQQCEEWAQKQLVAMEPQELALEQVTHGICIPAQMLMQ